MNIFNLSTSLSASIAVQNDEETIKLAKVNPSDYRPNEITTGDAVKVTKKVGVILGAIRNFSVVTSVIVLMVIGFKYIIGSVEQKANYKAAMLPYVIGCVMAIAGTSLVSFIYNAVH